MSSRCSIFFLALALVLVLGTNLVADPVADFAEANRLFEKDDFTGAVTKYETLARDGVLSPDLFYNLGAAKHRLGASGEGALWMRRALVLDPAMAEPRQSLSFLRSHLAYVEFAETRLARFIAALPAGFGRWAVSLGLWAGLLALASAFCVRRLRPNRAALVTLALIAFMASFVASRIDRYRSERVAIENFATVTQPETSAFTAPAPEAKAVMALPLGSEVRILQSSGPWTYVEIPGDLRGWVRSDSVETVCPIPSKTPTL